MGKRITTKAVQDTENLPAADRDLKLKPEAETGRVNEEGLTERQAIFVERFVSDAGFNATEAARMAGYSAENTNVLAATGSRLLSYVKVKEAVARRLARANITPDWVKQQTAVLAASNMGTFLDVRDEDGEPEINWREAKRVGALVQIRKYKEKGAKAGEKLVIIERQIETHNPAPYLLLLARVLGLVKEGGDGTNVNVNLVVQEKMALVLSDPKAAEAANVLARRLYGDEPDRN